MIRIEVPILAQQRRDPGGDGSVYVVRPLFQGEPSETDRDLNRALARLANKLRDMVERLGQGGNHRGVSDYTFNPPVEIHVLDLRLELRKSMFRGRFPLATFRHFDRRVAFTPDLLNHWFELAPGERLAARATAVFTRYFRDLEKESGTPIALSILRRFEHPPRPWLTALEIDVRTRQRPADKARDLAALWGGEQKFDGRAELEKIGRCQDRLYPDGLERTYRRPALVDTLEKLLAEPGNRPVALVGPSLVGKTALVHEVVHRRVGRRQTPFTSKENVWLLSPQRLISGMSYVGQWESRVLAILKTAAKRDHVLYFDDVLGLFRAGISASASLSVADVLKPYIEQRKFRILIELTPEQLRVFRERDRGLADQFHLLSIEEPDEEENLRILLDVGRRLEARYRTRFDLEVLPTVLELTRRYQRDAAYPGKAALWLTRLAVKSQDRDVDRPAVLAEFQATSGLKTGFLDVRTRLRRSEVAAALREGIIGQQAAVDAMADAVTIAKARLNDPGRPLASLLFLGPTGVGKTQSAKALAQYLFGDSSRLLRFDMNEFLSADAAARLVGTFDQPEGLLTGAVRRQPFAVVLLDEIEKAHPDVFDLLLQLLGEARLTDALGRTTDFSNAVVILTSNLGTRQAARAVGFAPEEATADDVYRKAVEDFFRPEFFNRLDRIVPFRRLDRADLERIARRIMADVAGREGLSRRQSAVQIEPEALAWVVERGFHRTLGARAMRRAVERELVQPVAVQLAAISSQTPTVLNVRRRGEELSVQVSPLVEIARLPESRRPELPEQTDEWFVAARTALDRIDRQCQAKRPPGSFTSREIPSGYAWYVGVHEYLRDTRARLDEYRDRQAHPRRSPGLPALPSGDRPRKKRTGFWQDEPARHLLRELLSGEVDAYLDEIAATPAGTPADPNRLLRYVLDRLALLEMLAPGPEGWPQEQTVLLLRALDEETGNVDRLASWLFEKYAFQAGLSRDRHGRQEAAAIFGLEATRYVGTAENRNHEPWSRLVPEVDTAVCKRYGAVEVLVFEGYRARQFLVREEGTHLFAGQQGQLHPIQAALLPLAPGQSVGDALTLALREAAGERPIDRLFDWRPVVAVYTVARGLIADPRCGLTAVAKSGISLSDSLMATLPLPEELNRVEQ